MKIVKQFEDPQFLQKVYHWRENLSAKDKWVWGLGDDGELYFRCSIFTDPDEWSAFKDRNLIANNLSIKDMKRIVKEFGHLVVFT